MVHVIITFKTTPEKREDFRALLETVKVTLPTAEGCRGVRIYTGTETPDVFTMVEEWDTEEAHKTHMDSVIASGGWDVVLSHLSDEPETAYYVTL